MRKALSPVFCGLLLDFQRLWPSLSDKRGAGRAVSPVRHNTSRELEPSSILWGSQVTKAGENSLDSTAIRCTIVLDCSGKKSMDADREEVPVTGRIRSLWERLSVVGGCLSWLVGFVWTQGIVKWISWAVGFKAARGSVTVSDTAHSGVGAYGRLPFCRLERVQFLLVGWPPPRC